MIKEYVIKDIFLIQVIVSVSVINRVILVNTYLDCKCKKKIIDLIVEKCTEYDDDDQTKIVNITFTKTDNKTRIFNKTVTKNDSKTKLIIIAVTKNDNQTKMVNKTVKK